MNGNHDEVVENPLRPSPHFGFHIHRITEEEIKLGNTKDPKFKEETNKYASYEEALGYFIRHTNIIDGLKYFPNINQLGLFD